MRLIADLHIHSHYSRATSKTLDFPNLAKWAQLKGVDIVGTGDISHPGWLAEMHENLEPAESGLFRLKPEIAQRVERGIPASCRRPVRFLLAGEISSIYKKGGKTRKVHNVIFAPSLEVVAQIQVELEKIGNIRSDGRPILGLPSRDLLEIVLGVDPSCHLIPAHIWTPWFSMLGSKSGYDSVEECFEDLTPHIFALETGLSSDPPMNWRVSNLDRYTLVSSSDAHSPPKLAREATLFEIEPSYDALFAALQSGDPARCLGTLEFFPEEGKYHHDGHRKCHVNWKPAVTLEHDGICPVCGKPVTVGVGHRVEVLADRPEGSRKPNAHPFYSLIPLPEIISELVGVGPNSKRVQREYQRMLAELGPELVTLLDLPLEDIARVGGEKLAGGIGRMRRGEVTAIAGYDGEYGVIKLFDGSEENAAPQMSFFAEALPKPKPDEVGEPSPTYTASPVSVQYPIPTPQYQALNHDAEAHTTSLLAPLNDAQRAAVLTTDRPLIIVAGPGTGKTRTLTARIAYLIQGKAAAPAAILAITFTNKAAGEMAERLQKMVGAETAGRITIKTFHAFGTQLLRQYADHLGLDPNFVILSDDDRRALAKTIFPDLGQKELNQTLDLISAAKNQLDRPLDDREGAPLPTSDF
ncbi:MAG TPA: UvrD-helicase domain-containing protein [Caldilineae bacterium]|nr:UvrD-helicase domain-containing protein [Caldilineae bacterium]